LFNYSEPLFGNPPTLYVWIVSVDSSTGEAQLNGVDMQPLSAPFTWHWGDGSVEEGWFPQAHTYTDMTRNYIVTVISHNSGGGEDTAQALVRFIPASYAHSGLPSDLAVSVPTVKPTLGTRLYSLNPDLSCFDDSFFLTIDRASLESILTLMAQIEMDLTNDDAYRYEGKFEQVMLRDSLFGGAYSIWFSDPVAFGAGDNYLKGGVGYSSLFHEMGHNLTLNTPAGFYYGGRIDGPANAIFSETMAQIYQHAAGWVLLNGRTLYDVNPDMAFEIQNSVYESVGILRYYHDQYISAGKPFTSWNDPPTDAALQTFMTLGYKFCEQAETSGMGYRAPLKRMMHLLQLFDQGLMDKFDQGNNTKAADTARATLMVAAMSYGFLTDMRDEFRDLNFPIDDGFYASLWAQAGEANTVPVLQRLLADTTLDECLAEYAINLEDPLVFSDPDGTALTYRVESSDPSVAQAAIDQTLLRVTAVTNGRAKIIVTTDDGNTGEESTAFWVTVENGCGCGCDCHNDPVCDHVIDIFDVVTGVNIAFRDAAPEPDPMPTCPRARADVDCSGAVDILDVIHLINVAFRNGNVASEFCVACP
jgi:hypothetical protein